MIEIMNLLNEQECHGTDSLNKGDDIGSLLLLFIDDILQI